MKLAAVSATILSLLTSATALAQSPPPAEAETLTTGVASGGTKISGWFLAPTFGTTGFGDRLNYTPGLRGGIYLNKRFAVGLAAQGLASSATTLNDHEQRNLGSYGGLLLQYIWHSDQLFHGTLESTIGDGRWCAAGTGGSDSCSTKDFLVFEPAANLELNVAKHVRFATGVGYRFAVAGSGEGPSSRDMSSLVVRTSLIFGSF
jgi:opacity protein-like surface antigen